MCISIDSNFLCIIFIFSIPSLRLNTDVIFNQNNSVIQSSVNPITNGYKTSYDLNGQRPIEFYPPTFSGKVFRHNALAFSQNYQSFSSQPAVTNVFQSEQIY